MRGTKRKVIFTILVTILTLSMFIVGCGKGATETENKDPNKETSVPNEKGGVEANSEEEKTLFDELNGYWLTDESQFKNTYTIIDLDNGRLVGGFFNEDTLYVHKIKEKTYDKEENCINLITDMGDDVDGRIRLSIEEDGSLRLSTVNEANVIVVDSNYNKKSYNDCMLTKYGAQLDTSFEGKTTEEINDIYLNFNKDDIVDKNKEKGSLTEEEALQKAKELGKEGNLTATPCDIIPGIASYKIVDNSTGKIVLVVFKGGVTSEDCLNMYKEKTE